MGVSSSLILRKRGVPRLAEIVSAAARSGTAIGFPSGIELDAWDGLWMPLTLNGVETGFDFALAATAGDKGLPRAVRKAGPTILHFEARGEESRQATDAVREAIASLVPASTWFPSLDTLVDPDGQEHDIDGEPEEEAPWVAPPPPPPPALPVRILWWLLDRWLLTGLVGGAIAIFIGAMVGS